jgi:hypothetical protein
VSFEEGKDTPPLAKLYKNLVMKSLDTTPDYADDVTCVGELNDTNKNSYGKIWIKISTLQNFFCTSTFYFRITTGPYFVTTREITLDQNLRQRMVEARKRDPKARDPDSVFNNKIN